MFSTRRMRCKAKDSLHNCNSHYLWCPTLVTLSNMTFCGRKQVGYLATSTNRQTMSKFNLSDLCKSCLGQSVSSACLFVGTVCGVRAKAYNFSYTMACYSMAQLHFESALIGGKYFSVLQFLRQRLWGSLPFRAPLHHRPVIRRTA